MMLEEIIRYAIDGILLDPDASLRTKASRIQELVDILIDFPDETDNDLKVILANYNRNMLE